MNASSVTAALVSVPDEEQKRHRSLIHRYLNAGVMNGTKVEPTHEGTPQGGPLSPLLANILLNELDKELERRGHPFVRYADDGLRPNAPTLAS